MYYLYKKTHNQTNMKYLGKTTKNPYTYKGSGINWKHHLKQYGNDVTTEIIFESEDRIEIGQKGRYYSALWNIMDSNEWANIIPETGGGFVTEEAKEKMSLAKKGKPSSKKGIPMSEEQKQKLRKPKSEEAKKKTSEAMKKLYKDPTNHPWFGRKHSEESKQKNRESHLILREVR